MKQQNSGKIFYTKFLSFDHLKGFVEMGPCLICIVNISGARFTKTCMVVGLLVTILRSSYENNLHISRWSYDCFTKLVVKGSQIYDLN